MAKATKTDTQQNPYNVELHLNAAEAELVFKLVGSTAIPGRDEAMNIYSALSFAGVAKDKYVLVPDYVKATRA